MHISFLTSTWLTWQYWHESNFLLTFLSTDNFWHSFQQTISDMLVLDFMVGGGVTSTRLKKTNLISAIKVPMVDPLLSATQSNTWFTGGDGDGGSLPLHYTTISIMRFRLAFLPHSMFCPKKRTGQMKIDRYYTLIETQRTRRGLSESFLKTAVKKSHFWIFPESLFVLLKFLFFLFQRLTKIWSKYEIICIKQISFCFPWLMIHHL